MMPYRKTLSLIVFLFSLLFFGPAGHAQIREPDVIFVATPQDVVKEMLKIAGLTKDDVLYDLGCGDGRIVITAAKEFGARGIGVDIDPQRIRESNENARKAGVAHRVTFLEQDLFQMNISEATVVTLYLLDELNLRLRPKLLSELKPGTRVVSHDFEMADWRPDRVVMMNDSDVFFPDGRLLKHGTKFNFWVIPAQAGGIWRWGLSKSQDQPQYALNLDQRFQKIYGRMNGRGREIDIEETRLVGDRLDFVVRDEINGSKVVMQFNGRVEGDAIHGSVEVKGGPFEGNHEWLAKRDR